MTAKPFMSRVGNEKMLVRYRRRPVSVNFSDWRWRATVDLTHDSTTVGRVHLEIKWWRAPSWALIWCTNLISSHPVDFGILSFGDRSLRDFPCTTIALSNMLRLSGFDCIFYQKINANHSWSRENNAKKNPFIIMIWFSGYN